jgi:hypothetical protein
MTYEPSDFLVRLEFDKIIELIANNCLGNLGIEQAHCTRAKFSFN